MKNFVWKIITGLACGIMLFTGTISAEEQAHKSGARIHFPYTEKDFGRVDQGAHLEHSFVFTNEGTETLEILHTHASCGCTAVQSATAVAPGATGAITLTYNTAGRRGSTQHRVSVRSNDPVTSEVTLHIKADVFVPFFISPPHAVMGLVAAGESGQSKTLTITSGAGVALDIQEVNADVDWLEARVKPRAKSPETPEDVEQMDLVITMTKPLAGGRHSGKVILKTGHTGKTREEINVQVSVVEELNIDPMKLEIGEVEAGKAATYPVVVSNRDPNVYLGAPIVELEGAHGERIMRYQEDGTAILYVTITPDYGAQSVTGNIIMRTNHPVNKEVTIPVTGTVKNE